VRPSLFFGRKGSVFEPLSPGVFLITVRICELNASDDSSKVRSTFFALRAQCQSKAQHASPVSAQQKTIDRYTTGL